MWYSFRQGDRSEYLAQYILSALGVVVPVPRQEDIGADFHCTLANREGKRLTFHAPFLVQVKSRSRKKVSFGGIDQKGNWKQKQIEWLFSQELPLLIGIADKQKLTLALYSTSNIWAACYLAGRCGKAVLLPDKIDSDNRVPMPTKRLPSEKWPHGAGDGHIWDVPLGPPIVHISIDDLEDKEKIDTYRGILLQTLYREQENITYRRLGVHYSTWPHQYTTNEYASHIILGFSYAWNNGPGANTPGQIQALTPIVIALANNYKAQNRIDELAKLKPIFELIPHDIIPGFVKSYIPELFSE
jgi:hypothetical protein